MFEDALISHKQISSRFYYIIFSTGSIFLLFGGRPKLIITLFTNLNENSKYI